MSLTKDEVVLLQLASADLLLESVAAQVHIGEHPLLLEDVPNLLGILVGSRHDRNNEDLAGAQPERPLASKVLGEHTKHALKATHDGSVNHDWARVSGRQILRGIAAVTDATLILACQVSKLESSRKVKVQLDGTALVVSAESIVQSDVDLGAVESTVTGVHFPLGIVFLSEGVQSLLKLLLG